MDLEQQEKQESGMSLSDIFNIVKKSWILISAFTVFIGIIVGVYAYTMVDNQYKSTSEVLVQVPTSTGDPNDGINFTDTQRLIQTAAEFVASDNIINEVRVSNLLTNAVHASKLASMSNVDVKKAISVYSSTSSFIIRISFNSTDGDFSQVMTQAITTVVIETEVSLFKDKFFQLSAAGNPEDDSPNKILYLIVGIIGGAIVGLGIAFVKELLSNSYMTKEQLEIGTGIQVLGVIPEFDMKEKKHK